MTDVFISYQRSSENEARQVAALLRSAGHDVWLDADLPPNRAYADVIRERLEAANAVLVLWTKAAAASEWVRAEADFARERHKLVQASLDGSIPPLPFNQTHCDSLVGLTEKTLPASWSKIAAAVAEMSGKGLGVPPETFTPERAHGSPAPFARRTVRTYVVTGLSAALLVVVASGLLWLERDHLPWVSPRITVPRLAILPFRVDSAEADARYFASGLTDEIQGALNNDRYQVVSRADAETLTGADADHRIDQLGVRLLFDGAVQQNGPTLSVDVNLNDPKSHVSVWSSRIDGETAKPDALRAHVAALIVTVLNCAGRALSPTDGLADPAVLTQYLKACDGFARSGEDHAETTADMLSALRQVTKSAPRFPPAHSALAKYLAYGSGAMPPDQALAARQEATSEANKALALDPTDADAYVALELMQPSQAWAKRESLLRQGLAGNPDWPHANGFLGIVLWETGRLSEAASYFEKATAEDRPGQNWEGLAAQELIASGRVAEADDAYAEMFKNWPDSPDDWAPRLQIRIMEGRWTDAEAVLKEPMASTVYGTAGVASTQAFLQAMQSQSPALREQIKKQLLDEAAKPGAQTAGIVDALSALGYIDDAYVVALRAPPAQFVGSTEGLFSPEAAAMRKDARFLELVDKIGLLRFWRETGKWPDFCKDPGLPYACK